MYLQRLQVIWCNGESSLDWTGDEFDPLSKLIASINSVCVSLSAHETTGWFLDNAGDKFKYSSQYSTSKMCVQPTYDFVAVILLWSLEEFLWQSLWFKKLWNI